MKQIEIQAVTAKERGWICENCDEVNNVNAGEDLKEQTIISVSDIYTEEVFVLDEADQRPIEIQFASFLLKNGVVEPEKGVICEHCDSVQEPYIHDEIWMCNSCEGHFVDEDDAANCCSYNRQSQLNDLEMARTKLLNAGYLVVKQGLQQ